MEMNLRQGFEEGSEGFATNWTLVSVKPEAYYTKNGAEVAYKDAEGNSTVIIGEVDKNAVLVSNTNTKTRYWEAKDANAEYPIVTLLPAEEAVKHEGFDALPGGVQIQLPANIGTTEAVTFIFTLEDVFGVQKEVKVVVKAAK